MNKDKLNFLVGLLIFTGILYVVHYSIFYNFFSEITLYIPIWSIYCFNSVVVLIVYSIIKNKTKKESKKGYNAFLLLTFIKMILAIVFLLPLFSGESTNTKTEVINFFIPYFFFLTFEILAINKLLKSKETK